MKKKMNNTLIIVSLSVFALLTTIYWAYVLYNNVDKTGQTVEGFFTESGCDASNQILSDLTEEDTENVDIIEDTEDIEEITEHSHDKLVRKTGVYPLLRTLGDKLDKKCPKLPDMSKYVLKSKIKPDKKCPDLNNYVLKTNILPEKKCPDCVCPKVNVSAGLCKKCEPCPACPPPKRCPRPSCPKPRPCPEVKCPKTQPCPPQNKCPRPRPCKPCRKPKCSGCPYCEEKSDGLLHHPKYPGSKDFESLRANNGQCDGEPDPSILNKFKNLF